MQQNQQIVGIDAAMLGRECKKVIGIFHDELIERIASCNQDRERSACAAACASGLLPGAGNRAGVAGHDAGFQIADINTQFQGVGADHAHHFACPQTAFYFAAQIRQVTTAVAGDIMIVLRFGFDKFIFEIFGQHFNMEAAGGKNDGLDVVVDQIGSDLARRRHRTLANAQFAVDDGRVIQNKRFGGRGRAAFIEQGHLALQYFFGMLARIGHSGRTADKHRIGPIETADPNQPADDIGEMRAEDASINMQFINDDVF